MDQVTLGVVIPIAANGYAIVNEGTQLICFQKILLAGGT